MRTLVTGATGFIGSRLAATLIEQGHQVRVLRRSSSPTLMLDGLPVEHVIGDILEPEAVAQAVAGCDVVYHVAALSSYWRAARAQVYRVNVEGTRITLDACFQAGVPRVVVTSSVAAIGIPSGGKPADESHTFDAFSASFAYADSKHKAEAEVRRAVERGLHAVMVNPGAVMGAGDHNLITGSLIVAYGRRAVPIVTPGGLCVADVEAVVQGHLAAAERGRPGERYILGGENLTHRQIAGIITEVVGRHPPRWTLPRWVLPAAGTAVDVINRVRTAPPVVSGEQLRLSAYEAFYDSGRAVRELGYPILPFRGAVEKAYRWYKDHGYMG